MDGARATLTAAVLAALAGAAPGCADPEPADDDSAVADDDAADDDSGPSAPVISDLQIRLDQSAAGDELVFAFHFEDPDADIPGGTGTIFVDGELAAAAQIGLDEEAYTSGDLELALDVPKGNLTYGATFLFGVSLTDFEGLESNRLEMEYTIPADE